MKTTTNSPNAKRRALRRRINCNRPVTGIGFLLVAGLVLLGSPAHAATNDLTTAIQRGLFEEEANQNLGAAIAAYQTVAGQFDKDRKLAATAIFRLGECYRKQGNTNDAATQYERILREFSDQPTLVTLSRQNLAALGSAPPTAAAPVLSDTARQEQKRLLEEEIKLVEKQLAEQQKRLEVGQASSGDLLPTQRDLLKLKRQIAALDAGLPVSIAATETTAPAASTETDEVRRIQALIKDSPDLINAPDRKGETLLQSAAAKGKLAVVKLLLENGAAVDGLQQPALTPLHYAAANGHKAIVDLLLSKGAKADTHTERGVTPLHLAALKGYETVAKSLLTAGAPVNAQTTRDESCDIEDVQYQVGSGQTPLHLAANAGYSGMVELLLAKGADANAEDGADRTPLSLAAQKHYLAVMQALLAAHANPNAGQANLPLATAAYQGDLPAVKLLLANGADPNASAMVRWGLNVRGGAYNQGGKFTPLFLAVSQHKADAVREMLLGKLDLNLPGQGDQPLLYDALADAPTLKALLEGGADPNQSVAGKPLLMLAVFDNNQAAVELLLAHQAKVDAASSASDTEGWTPLHAAAHFGLKSIAELLLKAGAAVNAREKDGSTPLHEAVRQRYPELAELLLANKADPNERDNSGHTPLDAAKSQVQSAQGQPVPGMPRAYPAQVAPGFPGNPPPYNYQSRALGTPATVPAPQPKPEAMVDLLRRHGAADDLPRLDCIELRRPSANYSSVIFTKGTNNWNQFTLLELIAVQYHFLAGSPWGEALPQGTYNQISQPLLFPDLVRVRIRRPGPDPKVWQERTIDIESVLTTTNCEADVPLQWGDVVEITEADHPVDVQWAGFPPAKLGALEKCLTRQVELVIKGQATNLTLAPSDAFSKARFGPANNVAFWIKPVIWKSGLVLASSDLSRVKVTRRDPATGKEYHWVLNCSGSSTAPDFWLRDGDKVEVPERTGSASAEGAMLAPPSSPGVTAQTTFAQRLQSIAQRAPQSSPGLAPLPTAPAEALQATAPGLAPSPAPAAQRPRSVLEGQPMRAPRTNPIPQPSRTPLPFSYYQSQIEQPGQVPVPRTLSAGPGQAAHRALEPPGVEKRQADIVAVRYSAKFDDARLLKEGYHRDRSARTRRGDSWEQRATADLPGRGGNTVVWTGTDMIVFGGEGQNTSYDDGARYCFAEDTWTALPKKGAPLSRSGHAAVWTGKEMIVWGGFGGVNGEDVNHNDGARYNPSSDTWKPICTKNAPEARFDFPAVWTGREMLVWGGYTDSHSRYQGGHADAHVNTGGRYDPSSDSWKTITTKGAPSKRCGHTMVWTGKEMIVWGGANTTKVLNDGGRYNPARDAWRPVSTDGAPSPRGMPVAVWTGKEMIVWGGAAREPHEHSDYYENGARYSPATDSWRPVSSVGAPKGRVLTFAVWTGTEMIVWGGVNDAQAGDGGDTSRFVGTGARYNPATDTWTEMTVTGAPTARLTSGVWTSDGLLTFGGYNGAHLNDIWFYSPSRTLYTYSKQQE